MYSNIFNFLGQVFTWLLMILAVAAILFSNNNEAKNNLEFTPNRQGEVSAVSEKLN